MSVRLVVLSALGAVAALPSGLSAQERQPVSRPRIFIDEQDPQELRDKIRAITQRRARLGVTVDLRANDTDSIGARLQSVTPGGPGAKAGLRSGDIITQIDGENLVNNDGMKTSADESLPGMRLVELAAQLKPNTTIKVVYRRDRATAVTSLVTGDEPLPVISLERFPDGSQFEFKVPGGVERSQVQGGVLRRTTPGGSMTYSMVFGGPLADLELAPLNPDLGQYFGTTEGVLVINLPKESTLGLRGGDVILSIDGRKATGPGSLLRILRSYEAGDSFKLDIMRNRARTTVTGKLEKDRD
jgi:S1-C subfamily serine protease